MQESTGDPARLDRDSCLRAVTSTSSVDRRRFETALGRVLLHFGLKNPEFVWVDGIGAAAMLVAASEGGFDGRERLCRELEIRSVGIPVHSMKDTIADSLLRNLREPMGAEFEGDLSTRLGYWLGTARDAEIRSHVVTCWLNDGPIKQNSETLPLRGPTADEGYSDIDRLFNSTAFVIQNCLSRLLPNAFVRLGYWTTQTGNEGFGFFSAFNLGHCARNDLWESMGMQYRQNIRAKQKLLREVAESGFWFWPGSKRTICCERPSVLKFDEQFMLHCVDGPALAFRDGFEAYVIHNVEVPEYVITRPYEITVARIEAEENAEVRRIMTERFGYGRYLSETGAKVLDMDVIAVNTLDEAFGSMPRALMEDKQGQRWLVGTDGSTKRVYYMRAPSEANTCAEAHSALAGFDENQIIASS